MYIAVFAHMLMEMAPMQKDGVVEQLVTQAMLKVEII
jgi:hypothetical protein